jgi:hypothetical protein
MSFNLLVGSVVYFCRIWVNGKNTHVKSGLSNLHVSPSRLAYFLVEIKSHDRSVLAVARPSTHLESDKMLVDPKQFKQTMT